MITKKSTTRLCLLLCLGLLTAGTGHAQAPFKIGQPAPEFKAGRWVKGGPVAKLEPGQIYVMEFWATWCGPCIAAMPHLSELARKHTGKVTMIGVNILEHGTGEKADRNVDKLVEQKGRDLDYSVCRDTADEYLTNHWFKPTRFPGIPTTVVVDAQGKIAWMGHPKDLDPVLDDLLAGKFDYDKSAATYAAATTKNDAMMAVFNEYGEAIKAKDWAKAIAVVDNNPQYATSMWLLRFNALLKLDAAQAFEKLKDVVAKKDRGMSAYLSATAGADDLPREMYQYVADQLGQNPQPASFGTLASLAHRLGDSAKAVEYQQKFKEFVLQHPQKPTLEVMERIENDLLKYEGKR